MNSPYSHPGLTRTTDEAEKPFWISYADLMTALMILFLVVMVVALSSVTKKAEEVMIEGRVLERKTVSTDVRAQEIRNICEELSSRAKTANSGAHVDCALNRINFGEFGQFKSDEHVLSAEGQQALLQVVPLILNTANTPLGQKWLKQVVIEGFTDTDGAYLYNLHLSLKRSEWVMCTLLKSDQAGATSLSPEERREIKKLFLAGGVAFNNARTSKDASRRVELRLQFYGAGDDNGQGEVDAAKFEDNPKDKCMI